MIALVSRLPLLRVGRYEVTTYGPDWLEENIRTAARAAGQGEWLFTEDIVSSLLVYLRECFPGAVITLEELSGKIRIILEQIGFEDISRFLELTPPALTFSLDDLAREAGEGFELRFFQLLDARISELAALRVPSVALTFSREGVKRLCAARTWNQSCRALVREITLFLGTRLSARSGCRFEMAV